MQRFIQWEKLLANYPHRKSCEIYDRLVLPLHRAVRASSAIGRDFAPHLHISRNFGSLTFVISLSHCRCAGDDGAIQGQAVPASATPCGLEEICSTSEVKPLEEFVSSVLGISIGCRPDPSTDRPSRPVATRIYLPISSTNSVPSCIMQVIYLLGTFVADDLLATTHA